MEMVAYPNALDAQLLTKGYIPVILDCPECKGEGVLLDAEAHEATCPVCFGKKHDAFGIDLDQLFAAVLKKLRSEPPR